MNTQPLDYVSSEVLFQLGEDELLYPVLFFSKNLNLVECNYKICNKELLAIIPYFKQWKPNLEVTEVPLKWIIN